MTLQWAHIRALCSHLQPQGEFGINLLQSRDVSTGVVCVVRLLQHLPCLSSSAHRWFWLAAFSGGVAWLFSLCQQRGAVSPGVPALHLLPAYFLRVWALQGGLSQRQSLCPHPHCPLEVTVTQVC